MGFTGRVCTAVSPRSFGSCWSSGRKTRFSGRPARMMHNCGFRSCIRSNGFHTSSLTWGCPSASPLLEASSRAAGGQLGWGDACFRREGFGDVFVPSLSQGRRQVGFPAQISLLARPRPSGPDRVLGWVARVRPAFSNAPWAWGIPAYLVVPGVSRARHDAGLPSCMTFRPCRAGRRARRLSLPVRRLWGRKKTPPLSLAFAPRCLWLLLIPVKRYR